MGKARRTKVNKTGVSAKPKVEVDINDETYHVRDTEEGSVRKEKGTWRNQGGSWREEDGSWRLP